MPLEKSSRDDWGRINKETIGAGELLKFFDANLLFCPNIGGILGLGFYSAPINFGQKISRK